MNCCVTAYLVNRTRLDYSQINLWQKKPSCRPTLKPCGLSIRHIDLLFIYTFAQSVAGLLNHFRSLMMNAWFCTSRRTRLLEAWHLTYTIGRTQRQPFFYNHSILLSPSITFAVPHRVGGQAADGTWHLETDSGLQWLTPDSQRFAYKFSNRASISLAQTCFSRIAWSDTGSWTIIWVLSLVWS